MANDIANLTDSVSNQLRNDRAMEAFRYAKQSLEQHQRGIERMEDRLADLRREGVYDYPVQIEGLNDQYATALAEGQPSRAANILGRWRSWRPMPPSSTS